MQERLVFNTAEHKLNELEEWVKNRKSEIINLCEEYQYGDENIFKGHRADAKFGLIIEVQDKMKELKKRRE